MTAATAQLSESLQTLIDSRLDTIDRMLLGRLSRQDRLAIVREVESQIHELLQERDPEQLTREDVLVVLARLDPPEAYIPDEIERERSWARRQTPARALRSTVNNEIVVGRISGILGLSALALMLFIPVVYMLAVFLQSEAVIMVGAGAIVILIFVGGILGLTLGVVARKVGPWPLIGIVASSVALFLSLAIVLVAILLVG